MTTTVRDWPINDAELDGLKVVGFTGSQFFKASTHGNLVDEVLFKLEAANVFVTGGCVGLDTYAARRLYDFFPVAHGHRHLIFMPQDQRTKDKVDWSLMRDLPEAEFYLMPEGSSNKDRNQAMVDVSTFFVGYPRGPEDSLPRSGTWQTLRMVQRKGIPHSIVYLS